MNKELSDKLLIKVASKDKTARFLAAAVKMKAFHKSAATEYANLPVKPSNALQGAIADQLEKGPRTVKRMLAGGGIGLLAGLLVGGLKGAAGNMTPDEVGAMVGAGGQIGLGAAGAYDALNRIWELRDDIRAYRAAEAKQNGIAKEDGEKKTASVQTKKKIIYTIFNDTMKKQATPVVAPSNVYFNTAADMAAEQPKAVKRVLAGGGIGLLAGLLAGGIGAATSNDSSLLPIGAIAGTETGLIGTGIYEAIRLANKQRDLVNKYRAAEAAQTTQDKKEEKA